MNFSTGLDQLFKHVRIPDNGSMKQRRFACVITGFGVQHAAEQGGSFGSGNCDRNGCFARTGGPNSPGACAGLIYPGALAGWGPSWNAHGVYLTQNSLFPNVSLPRGLGSAFVQTDALCGDCLLYTSPSPRDS